MPRAIAVDTLKSMLAPSGHIWTASPPTIVAPNVLAIVFRLRIAELVSSRPSLYFSNLSPLAGCLFFNASISAVVVLRIIASRIEQSAEMPIVKMMARVNAGIIGSVLLHGVVCAPIFDQVHDQGGSWRSRGEFQAIFVKLCVSDLYSWRIS